MADIIVPLSRLGDAIEEDIEAKVRKTIINVFAHLDSASPLGRPELWKSIPRADYRPGWFKANWRVIFGKGNDDRAVSATKRSKGAINIKAFKLGKKALIVNNAPYAQRLKEGWSQQAPLGWVDAAVRSGVRSASR